ncbi:MAG: hypothetical protein Q8L81_16770 [Bacteroidota bacterium]|nr:hypothetical protein [Bacteroidota bacterium]
MFRLAIITFLVTYCVSFFSQTVYSRDFETRKKNVPISIINNNPGYFFLLRYNKAAHDITLERRAKPSAEILSFTPLKLDSVNADWFDYEKLDHLFFEHNYQVYFLFERVLNSKKTLYLKIIDTLGKASSFIELATIEKEKGVTRVDLEYKRTQNNNILIIASQTYGNFAVKKLVLLFDVEKRKIAWKKKLPIENDATGYSIAFECNESNDLFCVFVKAHIASFKRKYINHAQMAVPVMFFDSLVIAGFLNNSSFAVRRDLAISNLTALNSIRLSVINNVVTASAHFAKQDNSGEENVYFFNQMFNIALSEEIYSVITPLNEPIKESLTFYDGTDYKNASSKEYDHFRNFNVNGFDHQVSERVEDYYFKELLVWKNETKTGKIAYQKIIPRKIYSFQGRTRFKHIAKAMPFMYGDKLHFILLEAPENFKKDANSFNFHRFKKETNLARSNLVMYKLNNDGSLEKKLIYHNAIFDAVPMPYQSNKQDDVILYLDGGKREKFAILKLDQFW